MASFVSIASYFQMLLVFVLLLEWFEVILFQNGKYWSKSRNQFYSPGIFIKNHLVGLRELIGLFWRIMNQFYLLFIFFNSCSKDEFSMPTSISKMEKNNSDCARRISPSGDGHQVHVRNFEFWIWETSIIVGFKLGEKVEICRMKTKYHSCVKYSNNSIIPPVHCSCFVKTGDNSEDGWCGWC